MKRETSQRVASMLACGWAGLMAGVGFVAAPILFETLARADAGRAASRLFALDAAVGLALGGLLLIATQQLARLDAESGRGSRFSIDMILALAALFCVVAGHFGLQPMIESARQGGAGGPSFGALHAASTLFFGARFVLLAVLAWRLTAARVEPLEPVAPDTPSTVAAATS